MNGTNADPRHPSYIVSPETIQAAGYTAARSVITPDHDMGGWMHDCGRLGIHVLPVVGRESLEDWSEDWQLGEYMAAAEALYARYGGVFDWLQVGNEPDLDSISSWTMEPETVNLMLEAFRLTWPGVILVGPGLANDQPWYADRLDISLYDVLALHGYDLMPDSWPLDPYSKWVKPWLERYSHIPKPIWITEFGGKRSEFRDEATRGAYYRALADNLLANPQVERVYAFCLDLAMHPQYGVRDYGNEIPGWTDLPNPYPIGGSDMAGEQWLGELYGTINVATIQAAEGSVTIEGHENGVCLTMPDGNTWSLPHVMEDPNDPGLTWVGGKPFRAVQ